MKMLLMVILLLSSTVAMSFTKGDTLHVRSDIWYPYNGDPSQRGRKGFVIDLLEGYLGTIGAKLDYRLLPWDDSVDGASLGLHDCVVGATVLEARWGGLITHGISVGMESTGFFRLTGDRPWAYTGLGSLKGQKVGVISGYDYDPLVNDYIADNKDNPKLIVLGGTNYALQDIQIKLVNGEVDIVIASTLVFTAAAKRMGYNGLFELTSLLGRPEGVYVACTNSPDMIEFLSEFDKYLSKKQNTGALERLLFHYGVRY